MAGINLTYLNATTFTVQMDRTDEFQVGRRIRFNSDVAPLVRYGTILTSTYSSATTVVLTDDSDDLHSTTDKVWYGIISANETSSSIPIHSHDGDEGSGGIISHTIASHNDTTATGAELDELTDGSNTTLHIHNSYELVDSTILRQIDVDDTPVNDVTISPISSNWAFDHTANGDAHHSENHTIASHNDTTATGAELETLTDGSNTTLHYHSTDRNRTNHTGTQTASTISDFDTEVSNNSSVVANTAKVTNANHTGDVIGSGQLSIIDNAVNDNHIDWGNGTNQISQDNVVDGSTYVRTENNLTDTLLGNITTNNAKVSNATHTGEVTGSGELTIADNVIDEANLKLDESPTNNYVLTADSTKSGGMKWAEAAGGSGSSPLTTKGDIYTYDTGDARLPIGTNDQVLTVDSSVALGVKWATPASGGGDLVDDTTPQLGGDLDMNEHSIEMTYMPNASDLTHSGIITKFWCDIATTFGDLLYYGSSGLAKADANGTNTYPAVYMAVETISSGNWCHVIHTGMVRQNTWNWTLGQILYMSETAGGITATAPTTSGSIVQVIGQAITADVIDFRPQLTWLEIE